VYARSAERLQPRRLDQELLDRGLAPSRSAAAAWIRDGRVRVDGRVETRAGRRVQPGAQVEVAAGTVYVGRGGTKLAAALDAFGIDPAGRTCADVGASTGGFTDCLLRRGAARVHAIDVGRGEFHARLRADPRVVLREGTDARALADLGERVDLCAIDVAFVAVRRVLPAVAGWLAPGADVVVLVKPQFEAGPGAVGRDGVVRDRAVHARVLAEVLAALPGAGLAPRGLVPSPLRGGAGNAEFLAWARAGAADDFDAGRAIADALARVHAAGS
jgi:23S rRNA (cytidine1920-2'-O)/16S rRNA (cytidine1409-2'-O)-methyltransferase